MKNARPRFALTTEGTHLYDYGACTYREPKGFLADGAGVWDLAKVAAMIDADAHIEAAFKLQSLVTEVVAENERRARVKELEEWQEWATNELNHLEALTKENAHLKALLEAAQSVSPVANGESIETLPGDPFGRPPEPTPEPKLDPSV